MDICRNKVYVCLRFFDFLLLYEFFIFFLKVYWIYGEFFFDVVFGSNVIERF